MTPKNDHLILDLIASDTEAAYRLLVQTYTVFVFNACLIQVPKKEDAEDLTQEVFIARSAIKKL